MVVASTGFFDGVHAGHQAILRQLSETAREMGSESAVVTFWPHPRFILGQDSEKLRLLTSLDEKIELIRECGIDDVKVIEFTSEFARMDASSFIKEYLVTRYSVDTLVVGYDHRIGCDCLMGEELVKVAGKCGVKTKCVGEHKIGASHISSTVIRQLIEDGDVKKAALLLGYEYRLRCTASFEKGGTRVLEPKDSQKIIPVAGRYSVGLVLNGTPSLDICSVRGNTFVLESGKCPEESEITFLERLY